MPALSRKAIMTERSIQTERKVSGLGLSFGEKIKILGIFVSIICATSFGFVASTIIGNMSVVLAGLGVVAFVFGLRHGVDADHIAAIDNTTRKLMQEGKRPLSVGFWFSLGHSTIVFALAFLIALGVHSLDGPVKTGSSDLHRVAGWIGTLVSGTFLYVIAAINVVILLGIVQVFREMKNGGYDEAELEKH